jgi:hypothetical protein
VQEKGSGRMAVLGMKTQTSSGSLNRRSFDLARDDKSIEVREIE